MEHIIRHKIKTITDNKDFKEKIKFFRKNKSTNKKDIYSFFLENDEKFKNVYTNQNLQIFFFQYYSDNMRDFYYYIEKWKEHIEDVYIHETSYCIIN